LREGRAFGTAAEYVVLPEQLALLLPIGVSFAEGSVMGIPAFTAHRCILSDGPVAGSTVLVAGGAGSVGQYAIQFAKLNGATVIATASGSQKMDRVRALGRIMPSTTSKRTRRRRFSKFPAVAEWI
jgi:NADPH2:quinone reductase